MSSYAVIQTGGKQYRVQPGDVIDVEKLDQEVGARVDLSSVLLVDADGDVSVGTPTVDGAKVTAEIADQFRGPKIIVYKYKAKTHYRRKNGHRQSYTRLRIRHILTGGAEEPEEVVEAAPVEEAPAPAPRRRRRSTRAAAAAAAPAEETAAEETVAEAEAVVAEEPATEAPEAAEAVAEEAPAEEAPAEDAADETSVGESSSEEASEGEGPQEGRRVQPQRQRQQGTALGRQGVRRAAGPHGRGARPAAGHAHHPREERRGGPRLHPVRAGGRRGEVRVGDQEPEDGQRLPAELAIAQALEGPGERQGNEDRHPSTVARRGDCALRVRQHLHHRLDEAGVAR